MKKIICLLIALSVIGSSALFADWYVPLNQVPLGMYLLIKFLKQY